MVQTRLFFSIFPIVSTVTDCFPRVLQKIRRRQAHAALLSQLRSVSCRRAAAKVASDSVSVKDIDDLTDALRTSSAETTQALRHLTIGPVDSDSGRDDGHPDSLSSDGSAKCLENLFSALPAATHLEVLRCDVWQSALAVPS